MSNLNNIENNDDLKKKEKDNSYITPLTNKQLKKKRKRVHYSEIDTSSRTKKTNKFLDKIEFEEEDMNDFILKDSISNKRSIFQTEQVDMVDDPKNTLKKTTEAFKATYNKKNNEFIKRALESLKSDDEMIVLNGLCELSSELSMACDNVADDSNCQTLIKELIILFDKFYMLPDIGMSSLNCLNYLLDINPRYTSCIIKWNGVCKIVKMTQNIEYIDCAESAIKAIEKMSFENPYAMIENDSFSAVLSLIDFFDLNLRKSALKACVNMTRVINNMDYIKKFIIPAIPSLTSLTKFIGNSEIEKSILDQAVLCFYNIVYCIKTYNLLSQSQNFYSNLIMYGLLENLFEVFEKFINVDQEEPGNTAKNLNIYHDTFKNILKLFELFCSLSSDITNLILNMNILEIINSVLVKELGFNSNGVKIKLSSNSHSVYNELFSLLISFFPNKKSLSLDRLLSENNKNFLHFFSEKILSMLVNNIVNIPSSNTMVQIIKLLEMYITYSPHDLILKYVDPVKFSNIASKMLDSKDSSYILEVFSIVEVIMNKVPEYFFVSFIREGVVDNIKNLQCVEDTQLYIPSESSFNKELVFNKYISASEEMDYEEEFLDEMEMLKEDSNNKIKDYMSRKQELIDMISKKFEIKGVKYDKAKDSDFIEGMDIVENVDMVENTDYQQMNNLEKVNINNLNIPTVKEEISESNTSKIIKAKIPKKVSYSNSILKTIHNKSKELVEKFFNDEHIQSLLIKTNSNVNPKEILQKLINIKDLLNKSNDVNINDLIYFADMIFSKDKVTFYEIEKSQIIYHLAKFFDENFNQNYENTMETDYKTKTILTNNYNKNIIHKLRLFFSAMNHDINKINEILNILQYCISSMNCFKLFLYDLGGRSSSQIIFSALKSEVQKLRLKFIYTPSEFSSKKLLEKEDNYFKDIYDYYLNKKFVAISMDQNETFDQAKESILKSKCSKNNISSPSKDECYEEIITQLRNRKNSEEDINLTEKILHKLIERKKSVESNIEEQATSINYDKELDLQFYTIVNNIRLDIHKDWTILEFIKEIKSITKKSDFMAYYSDLQINFDIIFINEIENIIIDEGKDNNYFNTFNYTDRLEENLFEAFYRNNLINNKSLYCIKRASPFIFLISLIELSVNYFKNLFSLKDNVDIKYLENLKVTSLLFKQVKDPYAISTSSIPMWCKELSQNFTFLSGFNSRYLLFKTSSFDLKRSMNNLYIYLKNFMGENVIEDKTLSNAKRHKFKIDRDNIIRDTDALMKSYSNFNGYIEFEYNSETGTGIGPTLEFYSLFAKELKMMPHLWYRTHDFSLFPTPCHDNIEENLKFFILLGFVIARGLYDDRLLDFPLNSLFWDLVFDRPVSIENMNKIDKDIGKAMIQFIKIIEDKKRFSKNPKFINTDIHDYLRYNNCRIDDIGLTFTLPGYNDIELIAGGSEKLVTAENLEEYVFHIFLRMVLNGPRPYIDAFKSGFNKVFPINTLKCFTSIELEEIICGCSQDLWDYETLLTNIIPNHGFDKNSFIYQGLLKMMTEMNNMEKKMFLLFVTGSPRLPLGGFKNLSPKMTVVKKQPIDPLENPDDYLPTVMTCQNYLKIPIYSSIEVLKQKLFLAMNEGNNAFHLS